MISRGCKRELLFDGNNGCLVGISLSFGSGNSAQHFVKMYKEGTMKNYPIGLTIGISGFNIYSLIYILHSKGKCSYYDKERIRNYCIEAEELIREGNYERAMNVLDSLARFFVENEALYDLGMKKYRTLRMYLGFPVLFYALGQIEWTTLETALTSLMELCTLPYSEVKKSYVIKGRKNIYSLTYRKEMECLECIEKGERGSISPLFFHRRRTSSGFSFIAQTHVAELYYALGFYPSLIFSDGSHFHMPYDVEVRCTVKRKNYEEATIILREFCEWFSGTINF